MGCALAFSLGSGPMSETLPPSFAALASRLDGVTPVNDAATRHILRVHGVEIGRVRPRGDDGFEFSENGTGPLTAIVIDGDRHDQVVAWQPDRPEKLRYLDGDRPAFIGRWYLNDRTTCRRPVQIFADVEAWLKAGRDGVVILDWSRFDPHSDLVGIPEVYCPSEAVKSRLEAACKPRFKITVRLQEGARDAA
jgi:hypothetical protein